MEKHDKKVLSKYETKIISFCQTNKLFIENLYCNQSLEDKYTFAAREREANSMIDYTTYTHELNYSIKQMSSTVTQ